MMQFLKNNVWTLSTLIFAFLSLISGNAFAASGDTVMDTAATKVGNVFRSVKTIVYILGGFGLVGLAWAAIFKKVDFKWLAALATGLAILAAASAIVEYATGSSAATDKLGTSFGNL